MFDIFRKFLDLYTGKLACLKPHTLYTLDLLTSWDVEIMQRNLSNKIYVLMAFLFLCTSCSSSHVEESNKFNLSKEEHVWLEKFFRYFMLRETAIYTLAGSKPLTEMSLFYEDTPEEQLREEKREEFVYFLLNRNDEKDMKFYEQLSPVEKEEKAQLVYDQDFIYNIEKLWDKWEKIQHRFPLKKQFLLVKKERPREGWKEIFPGCRAIYDIFFVDVLKTAMVIQENYELFKRVVGYDFDPLEIVFELENEHSDFWNTIRGKEAWKYSYLWGLLYGFGKENTFSHFWKNRHSRDTYCNEKEKTLAASLKTWSSCKNRPSPTDSGAFTISNFTIPAFKSFAQNDPVVAKYEMERGKIQQFYKGKDFVTFTLELLTDFPESQHQ